MLHAQVLSRASSLHAFHTVAVYVSQGRPSEYNTYERTATVLWLEANQQSLYPIPGWSIV